MKNRLQQQQQQHRRADDLCRWIDRTVRGGPTVSEVVCDVAAGCAMCVAMVAIVWALAAAGWW